MDRYAGATRYKHFSNVCFNGCSVDIVDGASFVFQYKDIFVDEIYRFECSKPPLILDCGANIGISVLYFRKLFPEARIIAFEPDLEIFKTLEKNIRANFAGSDIKLFNSAVWINNGQMSFLSDGADGGKVEASGESLVNCVRLRDFIEENGHVDLIKMDIEGAEGAVLADCSGVLDNVDRLFIEFHSKDFSNFGLSDVLKILENASFSYYLMPVHSFKSPLNTIEKGNGKSQINIFACKT
ncbi:MAG: FkbM family methyltransferase [Candidatus Rifleibacteriota bacterium]